jgi:valyl-tRNA synthetase
MTDRPGKFYYVRYFVDTKKDSFVVPVARPETLFGDV